MEFETNVSDGVRLDLRQVEVTDTSLTLSYLLANDSELPIYVANGLFHRRGAAGFEVDPNLAYAEVTDSSVLKIRKQVVEVPPELDVEAPEVPYFTRLNAGDELSEYIRMSYPIAPRHPYRRNQPMESKREVKRLTFTLGYVPADDSLDVREMTLGDSARYWWMGYSDAIRRQRLKECGPIELEGAVTVSGNR